MNSGLLSGRVASNATSTGHFLHKRLVLDIFHSSKNESSVGHFPPKRLVLDIFKLSNNQSSILNSCRSIKVVLILVLDSLLAQSLFLHS